MSKGSSPRPFSVSQAEFDNRFDVIFGKKNKAKDNKNVKARFAFTTTNQAPKNKNSDVV